MTPQNPARKGGVIIVYATGLGPVQPRVATGEAAVGPARIPSIQCIGSSSTGVLSDAGEVLYAGLAPGFPGLYQVNIRVSPSLPSGQASLRITLVTCTAATPRPFTSQQVSNSVRLPVE